MSNPTFNFTESLVDNWSSSNKTNARRRGEPLRYPYDIISSTTDYFKIEILKYPKSSSSKGFGTNLGGDLSSLTKQISDGGGGVAEQTIILPMPNAIRDSNGAGWNTGQMNDIQAWLGGKAGKIMETNSLGEAFSAAGTVLTDLKTSLIKDEGSTTDGRGNDLINLIKAKAVASAANLMGGNISAEGMLKRSSGQIVNQNEEVLFDSVNMRNFSFRWDMTPRSQTEGGVCKEIIRTLKQRSAPKRGKGRTGFLNAPDIFRISYMSGSSKHSFLNSFKLVALSKLETTYTASNTYATYPDGTPVHMSMSMTFKELNPIYAEDYGEGGSFKLKGVGY